MTMPNVRWPEDRRFAFTVFDDPDALTLEKGREVYALLSDLGFRTTKGTWPVRGPREPSDSGGTCDEPDYRDWCMSLQQRGFEMGWHNATLHTSTREETLDALERFRSLFGSYPSSMANHFACDEAIYWDEHRTSGWRRWVYESLTRYRYRGRSQGHDPNSRLFWGDACRQHIRYVRNFTFPQIDTLSACPVMPYHDPKRPFVQAWFASSDGNRASRFIDLLSERNQDALFESGGCCVVYTHFGHGFVENGKLLPRFVRLMERLAGMGGWYAPVSAVLDHLREQNGLAVLSDTSRAHLERRWLLGKVLHGAS
jgi:hypothetical protein